MNYIYYLPDGRRENCNCELALTHIVIGQRDEEAARKLIPETKGKTNRDFTPEELTVIGKFTFESTHGFYRMKVLAWAESLEQANALADKFKADRINVEVKEINPQHTIQYA